MKRWEILGVAWLSTAAGLFFLRSIFSLAKAANTEPGVIAGAIVLGLVTVAAMVVGVGLLHDRSRRCL